MQVLIPRLHQFFHKVHENIQVMAAIIYLFVVKLGPCHPYNFKIQSRLSDILNIQNTA